VIQRRRINISVPDVGQEELEALSEPIETGWLTQGPKVAAFESSFAEYHGVKHALATTSCTTGLHLALVALGIGPGDEVILPAFTWVATANVVLYCGATPVFVDIDQRTYNLDPAQVEARLTSRTRAVIAVHLFGLCADIDAIRSVLPSEVVIIEDAACATGALLGDRYAGGLGDVAVFSFHPRKTITTGEGGMVTTNDLNLHEHMQKLRNHGAEVSEEERHHGSKPYSLPDFNMLGFNYRMTDLQGAMGLVQLGKLERYINERAHGAENYREGLSDLQWLRLPSEPLHGCHAWQSFVTWVDPEFSPIERSELMERLQTYGIATRPGTHAVHMLGYYRNRFGFNPDDFPVSRDCALNTMAIPLHNRMTEEDYNYVIESIHAL